MILKFMHIIVMCSLMTYGCEFWTLTNRVIKKLDGMNSQILPDITGQLSRQGPCTNSHDIIRYIRLMRFE